MLNRAVPYIVCLAIGAFLGGMAVDRYHRGALPVYAPEQRTAPGDVVLETKPDAKPKLPAPTKPKGGKTTGTVEIEVNGGIPVRVDPAQKPDKSAAIIPIGNESHIVNGGASFGAEHDTFPVPKPGTNDSQSFGVVKECLTAQDFTCPPIKVRLDLGIRDGQQYVAVRTEDGQEVNGVFIPRTGVKTEGKNRVSVFAGEDLTVAAYTRKVLPMLSLGGGAIIYDGEAIPMVGGELSF